MVFRVTNASFSKLLFAPDEDQELTNRQKLFRFHKTAALQFWIEESTEQSSPSVNKNNVTNIVAHCHHD
jgi:hypothetical protein